MIQVSSTNKQRNNNNNNDNINDDKIIIMIIRMIIISELSIAQLHLMVNLPTVRYPIPNFH